MINNIFYEGQVLWSQVDANMHLRHSAYADFAAQARIAMLEKTGLKFEIFQALKIGPILFREETIYLREVGINEIIRVSCELTRNRPDGSRWSFRQYIFRSDDVKAAEIRVDGAWIDVAQRRLVALPEEYAVKFLEIPRSADFVEDTK
jgi:acyl-CoA thioester hydrolase